MSKPRRKRSLGRTSSFAVKNRRKPIIGRTRGALGRIAIIVVIVLLGTAVLARRMRGQLHHRRPAQRIIPPAR
jgi:hypothetical protein